MSGSRVLAVSGHYDLARSLSVLQLGGRDPSARFVGDEFCWAALTPGGPASLSLRRRADEVEAQAWGDGAAWMFDHADAIAGLRDDPTEFLEMVRHHRVLGALAAAHAGLRIPSTFLVVRTLVPIILTQKVTWQEAARAYAGLVRRFGEPAPGPYDLIMPPAPGVLARLPYWELHPLGVERRRAETIARAASHARRLEETATMPLLDAYRRLQAVSGIGPWTSAEVAQVAWGDADAVSVGDFHLPNQVAWALAGEARGSDERMLELLEPFAGHRARVTKLLVAAGVTAPKFGPRHQIRSIAGI